MRLQSLLSMLLLAHTMAPLEQEAQQEQQVQQEQQAQQEQQVLL